MTERRARAIAALLWTIVIAAALTVVVMVWHPWVTPWTGVLRDR